MLQHQGEVKLMDLRLKTHEYKRRDETKPNAAQGDILMVK